jgi:hypothetical protein
MMVPKTIKTITTIPVKSNMYVKCPECMRTAIEEIFSKSKLKKTYNLIFTENTEEANFVVSEGASSQSNELIAYSPIIAIFNSDEEYYNSLIDEEYFVQSQSSNEDVYDLNFKKIMDEIIDNGTSDFKIYCPNKSSGMWDEFYYFLIITENDGIYPNNQTLLRSIKARVNTFLESNNVGDVNFNNQAITNGFAKNSITFTTITEFYYAYKSGNSSDYSCRIMYPEYVIYHDYYMTYDDVGAVLKAKLTKGNFLYTNLGYEILSRYYFNNTASSEYGISSDVEGTRGVFNNMQIAELYYKEVRK